MSQPACQTTLRMIDPVIGLDRVIITYLRNQSVSLSPRRCIQPRSNMTKRVCMLSPRSPQKCNGKRGRRQETYERREISCANLFSWAVGRELHEIGQREYPRKMTVPFNAEEAAQKDSARRPSCADYHRDCHLPGSVSSTIIGMPPGYLLRHVPNRRQGASARQKMRI